MKVPKDLQRPEFLARDMEGSVHKDRMKAVCDSDGRREQATMPVECLPATRSGWSDCAKELSVYMSLPWSDANLVQKEKKPTSVQSLLF